MVTINPMYIYFSIIYRKPNLINIKGDNASKSQKIIGSHIELLNSVASKVTAKVFVMRHAKFLPSRMAVNVDMAEIVIFILVYWEGNLQY